MYFRKFRRDERGNTVNSISLMAGAVALASLAGAHFMDRATRDGGLSGYALLDSITANRYARETAALPRGDSPSTITTRQVSVDYTPTGSIPANLAQPVILDPCTGIRK